MKLWKDTLDINKIFGAFDSSSRDDNGFEQPTFLYTYNQDEENHPRYYIRMFTKLVLNFTSYNEQLVNFFGKSEPSLNVVEITQTGELMLYNRAYYYLTKLDIHDKYHIKILFEPKCCVNGSLIKSHVFRTDYRE